MNNNHYRLTKENLEYGINVCLEKVRTILDDVEILCLNNGTEATAVSLYTVAIEEYGKFLMLKDILNTKANQVGLYVVDKSIFGKGKRTHKDKFEKAIEALPEVCVEYHIRDINENENLFPPTYRGGLLHLREIKNDMKKHLGYVDGAILLNFDFEVRKNLLYVDWNEKMNNWRKELIKNGEVEFLHSMDELEPDWDTSVEKEWEKTLERSEDEAEIELEDESLDVKGVEYKNVRRLEYPKYLTFAVRFFKKYLTRPSNLIS